MVANKEQTAGKPVAKPQKRKEPPSSDSSQRPSTGNNSRNAKRAKFQDARAIITQTSDAALTKGELNVDAFLKAREFEIKALEDGMRRSKGALTTRAFQEVPRNMRRRTASHNVKRVPKRLRNRAAREMREDNTPTVTGTMKRSRNTKRRLRAETAKRLGVLAARKSLAKTEAREAAKEKTISSERASKGVEGRVPVPKKKKDVISAPPPPISKFKRRQVHKTWLPTHMYHTKRARMTEPKNPLWRFAIPLTPTEKVYRPTHRANGSTGSLCWDMSYMSTISLEGTEQALEKVLRGVGIVQEDVWTTKRQKWTDGKRSWRGWLSKSFEGSQKSIGPATVIWCAQEKGVHDEITKEEPEKTTKAKKPSTRKCIVRIHPSAFLELWTELLRLSKQQRPLVHIEDLRFEIGSIELTGPGSTEALLAILHPFEDPKNSTDGPHVEIFKILSGITNAAVLPPNTVLTFRTLDPRLRHPPRKVNLPDPHDIDASTHLLETIASWPSDSYLPSTTFFSREARSKASHLPSQKSINRRKGDAIPGNFPTQLPSDPAIPILLYTTRLDSSSSAQGTYTLLAPWKCILPFWYSLMYVPLSSGGNPRFAGLNELRQIHFEQGKPWFPGDFPGTDAGWGWELVEREKRKREWEGRPKGKRVEWGSLDLGAGRKGEVGVGWASDWEWFLRSGEERDTEQGEGQNPGKKDKKKRKKDKDKDKNKGSDKDKDVEASASSLTTTTTTPITSPIHHLPSAIFQSLLSGSALPNELTFKSSVTTIRLTLFSRGIPQPCARIYRLPSASAQATLRAQWLALAPSPTTSSSSSTSISKSKLKSNSRQTPASASKAETSASRRRSLAQSLLSNPPLPLNGPEKDNDSEDPLHPLVPDDIDLIGFVTSGAFNLAEGKGTGIGSVWVERVVEGLGLGAIVGEDDKKKKGTIRREDRFCIVRNAGERVGRLGVWEVV